MRPTQGPPSSSSATCASTTCGTWSSAAACRVHLTPLEYRLLALFVASGGRILTHRQMLRALWGPENVESQPYLRVYVGNLRRKLEADPARPRHILTETGLGYRFVR